MQAKIPAEEAYKRFQPVDDLNDAILFREYKIYDRKLMRYFYYCDVYFRNRAELRSKKQNKLPTKDSNNTTIKAKNLVKSDLVILPKKQKKISYDRKLVRRLLKEAAQRKENDKSKNDKSSNSNTNE